MTVGERTIRSVCAVRRTASVASLASALAACSAIPVIQNQPLPPQAIPVAARAASAVAVTTPTRARPAAPAGAPDHYSLFDVARHNAGSPIHVVLAFSGGGTRAAALSYGVLRAMRDVNVPVGGGRARRLIDEVDMISSVSGGSFTAAYYGLFGEKTFDDFERAFLRRNVNSELIDALLSPLHWFSTTGRTDLAAEIYADSIFRRATFADLRRANGPLVVINATDLSRGIRFSFLQEYFDLLCSDLDTFPVARAVTASSAVPLVFQPVVLQNHPGCTPPSESYLQSVAQTTDRAVLRDTVEGMNSYADKDARRYVHLVDGGISDNLGLRALMDFVDIAGGIRRFGQLAAVDRRSSVPRRLLVIAVNASTDSSGAIDLQSQPPGLEQTLNAVTDIQVHRYNDETVDQARAALQRWATELSTSAHPVSAHFVHLQFRALDDKRRRRINLIPTSLALSGDEVDMLVEAGGELLRENPDFQAFLAEVNAEEKTAAR